MIIPTGVVDRNCSFAWFVYPFFFDRDDFDSFALNSAKTDLPGEMTAPEGSGAPAAAASPDAEARNAVNTAELWAPDATGPVWKPGKPGDLEEILRAVGDYLNKKDHQVTTATLLERHPVASVDHTTPPLELRITRNGLPRTIKFHLPEVHLDLYRLGVGFLTLRVNLHDDVTDPDTWLHFSHEFRRTRREDQPPPHEDQQPPQQKRHYRSVLYVPVNCSIHRLLEPYKDRWLGDKGAVQVKGFIPVLLDTLIVALLHTVPQKQSGDTWWRDALAPGRLLPFIAMYVDGLPQGDQPRFLYKARNFFRADQEILPTENDLKVEGRADTLAYGKNQYFTFSLAGATFVAFGMQPHQPQPYYRTTLPEQLKGAYYLLFQLTLLQRLTLNELKEEVAKHWETPSDLESEKPSNAQHHNNRDKERLVAFTRIHDTLLSFMARGHFTQVTQDVSAHRVYVRWRETFQIEQLYREVVDAVQEMYQYLVLTSREREEADRRNIQQKQQRREQFLTVVGGGVVGSGWILTATGTNANSQVAFVIAVLFGAVGILVAAYAREIINNGFSIKLLDVWPLLLAGVLTGLAVFILKAANP